MLHINLTQYRILAKKIEVNFGAYCLKRIFEILHIVTLIFDKLEYILLFCPQVHLVLKF